MQNEMMFHRGDPVGRLDRGAQPAELCRHQLAGSIPIDSTAIPFFAISGAIGPGFISETTVGLKRACRPGWPAKKPHQHDLGASDIEARRDVKHTRGGHSGAISS
ncbi:MAG: hypothetical protein HC774_04555 [Sphingomonadales bacterium]|nr:hypothetical protein [Sphingomonadales bacterium]